MKLKNFKEFINEAHDPSWIPASKSADRFSEEVIGDDDNLETIEKEDNKDFIETEENIHDDILKHELSKLSPECLSKIASGQVDISKLAKEILEGGTEEFIDEDDIEDIRIMNRRNIKSSTDYKSEEGL